MFRINNGPAGELWVSADVVGKGFQITFENGYIVSVQFGSLNYGDYYTRKPSKKDLKGGLSSEKAEIAVMDPRGDFVPIEGCEVSSYKDAEFFLLVVAWASGLKYNEKR